MKMKKLLFTCAAVAGVSVALAASSFAAVIENDAGYSKEAGTYSVASDLSGYVTNNVADQMTILIIPEKAYNAATINDSDILYIDQTAAGKSIFQNVGILGGTTLADGTYYVKIGGENIAQDGIIVEKFTVKNSIIYGDVKEDGKVNALDVAYLKRYLAKWTGYDSTTVNLDAADVKEDGKVNALDVAYLKRYLAKWTGYETLPLK